MRGAADYLIRPAGLTEERLVEMPSGLVLPEWVAQDFVRPTAIDLFAGAGGMSLGVIQGGFDVLAAVDNDPLCAITYLYNLGAYPCQMHFVTPKDEARMEKALWKEHERSKRLLPFPVSGANRHRVIGDTVGVQHYWLGDIRKISGAEILSALGREVGEIDLVCGGPPCQGFTTAGKRDVMDPRNSLVFEFARLVLDIRPRFSVMENVPGMLNMVTPEGLPVTDVLCAMLEKGGWAPTKRLMASMTAQRDHGQVVFVHGHCQEKRKGTRRRKKKALAATERGEP